jgi:hypothetical protein
VKAIVTGIEADGAVMIADGQLIKIKKEKENNESQNKCQGWRQYLCRKPQSDAGARSEGHEWSHGWECSRCAREKINLVAATTAPGWLSDEFIAQPKQNRSLKCHGIKE